MSLLSITGSYTEEEPIVGEFHAIDCQNIQDQVVPSAFHSFSVEDQ